ncbi:50S ribosomal protein L25 [Crocosphaera sp. UHCC 0190]|uniref:50S ribosomal protein L25 n=1 Tax=unclassified Crocosphaera TaxID=2623705 RepID=UPI002B1F21C0|nr:MULTISPECIES: 50S ribosomal protein L25 [unclassified Crocosphaera]MEA5511112.1 50S ribosomal protein L25 [Crocosphaera sp. UHCC 0190]MEA5535220.1 50S ribosomal protein L25 [Crocosphaera sp. XPORK-15E]
MSLTIECQKRPEGSKPNALRREGLIPATLYGHDGTESMQLMVNQKEAALMLRGVKVDETVIEVTIPDLSWNGNAVIKEIQAHPWKRNLLHLSFCYVAADA